MPTSLDAISWRLRDGLWPKVAARRTKTSDMDLFRSGMVQRGYCDRERSQFRSMPPEITRA